MKQLILIFTLLFSITSFAEQSGSANVLNMTAQLTQFNANHNHIKNVNDGSIAINFVNQEIELTLVETIVCPINMYCPAYFPTYEVINLPLKTVEQGSCGEVVYKAELDKTPVDGFFQELVVTDYSNMTCEIAIKDLTKVVYTTYNPWANMTETSVFSGKKFVELLGF